MFLADASTKRPVAVSCLLIALVGLGLNSYRKLSLENLPATDIPYVTVTTTWVGATPEDMEKDVAKHIEDAVSSLDGLKHVESTCLENACVVRLEFQLGTDVDIAAVDVREKVDGCLEDLPDDAERPVIQKIDINATSVVKLAVTGDATLEEKYDYVDNTLADQFSMISGVGSVTIVGGNEREIHVELDRDLVEGAGLTTAEVVQAISANVNSLPSGRIREHGTEINVKFDAEYPAVDEIASFPVVSRKGERRTLGDLGRVFLTTDEVRQRAWFNGEECVLLSIVKKGEANTVKLVDACRKKASELQGTLPGGMRLQVVSDEAATIESTVSSTLGDIVGGILLCAAILFLFLGDFRTTLIVCVSMPLTIVCSFFFMQLAGQSLNTVTLVAIGLSVGILVSNSIVVLENVSTWMEKCSDPWEAANRGTSEMAISVFASAGTNVVVMLPLTTMWSLVGQVLKPFALTTLIVNVVSIFISFTLTPILCAVLLKPKSQRRQNAFTRLMDKWSGLIRKLGERYSAMLGWSARRRWLCLAVTLLCIGLFFLAMFQARSLGFTMMETSDKGKMMVSLEYPVNYDLEATCARVTALADELRTTLSDLENCAVSVGKRDTAGEGVTEAVYVAQIDLNFKSKLERSWTLEQRIAEVQKRMAKEPGVFYMVTATSDMGGISTPVKFSIAGKDLAVLENAGRKTLALAKGLPGISTVDATVREGKPQILVTPKRTEMRDAGISSSVLGSILRGNLEGIEAALYKSGDRSYDIRVKYSEAPGMDQVAKFLLPGGDGHPVLLGSVAEVTTRAIPVMIKRKDKERVVWVSGTLAEGAALQSVESELFQKMADTGVLPPGYRHEAAGDAEYLADAMADFGEAILLAAFLTYLTICAIMESFTRPFLILLTLPFGLMGVIWGLLLSGWNVDILVMLGALMLIGVVVNAAILIVDRYATLKKNGMDSREAMVQGAGESFRAVLMVILASALGMLPIALSTAVGSELRAGIGAASTGGVAVAGALTIFALPLIHCLFAKTGGKNKEKAASAAAPPEC